MAKKKGNNKTRKRQPVWKCVKKVLKLFFKEPHIVSLSGELPQKAIYVANHAAMFGPLIYSLHLPVSLCLWGAWPMLGTWKQRYRYLRDVYFVQKRHKSKLAASFLAFFETGFVPMFYKGMRVLPSYNDQRFISTLHKSLNALNNGFGILIFPENSSDGYHETLTEFYAGFVELAKYYRRRNGEDVPIYPVYYHPASKKMVIGFPSYYSDYEQKGMNRKQIANEFCRQVNELFEQHIKE